MSATAEPGTRVISTIGDVIKSKVDQGLPKDQDEFTYIDIGSIDTRLKKIAAAKRLPTDEAPSRARQRLQPGDVLVSMTRPNLNAVAQVSPEFEGSIASTGFCVLRANGVDSTWLFYRVQANDFIDSMVQ